LSIIEIQLIERIFDEKIFKFALIRINLLYTNMTRFASTASTDKLKKKKDSQLARVEPTFRLHEYLFQLIFILPKTFSSMYDFKTTLSGKCWSFLKWLRIF